MTSLKRFWAFLTKPEVYWRLFSLLLAITFWLLAAGDGTLGEAERAISLGVEVKNLPADLVLVDPPESVTVRIRGLSPLLNRGEGAVFASIDLSGAVEGTETYSVDVEGPLGINIISVTPGWVSVYTEELAQSAFPVTLALLGIDRTRTMLGLRPRPAIITVQGPRSILEQVDHVVAYLSVDSTLSLEGSFPVHALDAQGRSLGMLKIDPPEIKVVELEEEQADGEE